MKLQNYKFPHYPSFATAFSFLNPKHFPGIFFVQHIALHIVTSNLKDHNAEWYKVDLKVAVSYTIFSGIQYLFPGKCYLKCVL